MNFIKQNNYIIFIIICILLAIRLLYNNQQFVEIREESHKMMMIKDSIHYNDSVAFDSLNIKYDSIANVLHIKRQNESSSESISRGVVTITEVVEKTNKDGSTEKTTKTTQVDTSKIVSSFVKTTLDSMNRVIELKIDSVKRAYTKTNEITETKTEIMVADQSKIITIPKKMRLYGGVGVSSTIEPIIRPYVELGAMYDVNSISYIKGNVQYIGNPLTYNKNDYIIQFGLGLKLDI
jgi:hypothetical protein